MDLKPNPNHRPTIPAYRKNKLERLRKQAAQKKAARSVPGHHATRCPFCQRHFSPADKEKHVVECMAAKLDGSCTIQEVKREVEPLFYCELCDACFDTQEHLTGHKCVDRSHYDVVIGYLEKGDPNEASFLVQEQYNADAERCDGYFMEAKREWEKLTSK